MDQKYTMKTMNIYAEIVKIVGSQSHAEQGGSHYWSFIVDNISPIHIELKVIDDIPSIEIYEITDSNGLDDLNFDKIYQIMGYAKYHGIDCINNY